MAHVAILASLSFLLIWPQPSSHIGSNIHPEMLHKITSMRTLFLLSRIRDLGDVFFKCPPLSCPLIDHAERNATGRQSVFQIWNLPPAFFFSFPPPPTMRKFDFFPHHQIGIGVRSYGDKMSIKFLATNTRICQILGPKCVKCLLKTSHRTPLDRHRKEIRPRDGRGRRRRLPAGRKSPKQQHLILTLNPLATSKPSERDIEIKRDREAGRKVGLVPLCNGL